MTDTTKNGLLSLLRAALSMGAGVMVGKGWISDDLALQLVGAGVVLIPAAWGYIDKLIAERKTQRRVVDALNEPRETWTQEQRQQRAAQ